MTAAWYTRVSLAPPLVMVSVASKRFTHGLIKKSGSFCINLLAEDQVSIARNFGFLSGRSVDKFEGIRYKAGKNDVPILEDTAGYLECNLVNSYEVGDHTLFIGEVVGCGASDKKPLPSRAEDYV